MGLGFRVKGLGVHSMLFFSLHLHGKGRQGRWGPGLSVHDLGLGFGICGFRASGLRDPAWL